MSKFPYKALNNFVLRTPSRSLTSLKKLFSTDYLSDHDLKKISSDPFFQEALFLASPNLYNILIDWLNGKILNEEKSNKLKTSLLKYISRMSSRCTPFGLFAGYSIGLLNDYTDIRLNNDLSSYKKSTRLDMQYLVTLSQNLINKKTIRQQLIFSPNTSLYRHGNQYRYIEYTYSEGLKRAHHIEAVETDPYFEYILKVSHSGYTIDRLALELTNFDSKISIKEAKEYINLLIDNQILTSNIDPVIIGKDYFSTIREAITSKKTSLIFNQVSNAIGMIDNQIPNQVKKYNEIKSLAENLETEIDLKYFFQTDLKVSTYSNLLDRRALKDIKEGIIFLNKLSIISKNATVTYMDNFIKKFRERYEDQEVPLTKALDPESGIGYKNNDMSEIIPDNNFIDHLMISSTGSNKAEISWTNTNSIFHYKITEAYKSGDYTIQLNTEDLPSWIEEAWDDLPDTLSFMTEFVKTEGKQKIKLDGAGGASGSNLFGRFCLNDDEIKNHTQAILDIEKKINQDIILADLSHLPESRIGNVICRPGFNDYEIPYLSNSIKPNEYQILIDDLMISLKSDKIILRSKKLNKRILPRLVNAHNYAANSIPIYHFLCDLQYQGKRSGLGLELGPMEKNYKFIPRIELNNLILKPATWNLRKKDMEIFTENLQSDVDLMKALDKSRKKWKMPQYILLAENDNELLINLSNISSVKMMLDAIGEKANFTFKEFLFTDEEQIVRKEEESFTNQIVITFYNQQKLSTIQNA